MNCLIPFLTGIANYLEKYRNKAQGDTTGPRYPQGLTFEKKAPWTPTVQWTEWNTRRVIPKSIFCYILGLMVKHPTKVEENSIQQNW